MRQTTLLEMIKRSETYIPKTFCKYCRGQLSLTGKLRYREQAHSECRLAMRDYEWALSIQRHMHPYA